jgi:hypothetical protein
MHVRLQRRTRFQITTGPGGSRLGASAVGCTISCMKRETLNMAVPS